MEPREDPRHSVKAWMSAPSHTVTPDTPAREAFRRMRLHHLHHLLVMDRQRLVGVVTDRDFRRPEPGTEAWTLGAYYLLEGELLVGQLMTRELVTIEEDAPTAEAARTMLDKHIGCLPVMRHHECVGIVTTTDLMKALAYLVEPDATWSFEMPASA
jgi:CBS domain-containing protein